ncbi:hypothetical protein DXG03_006021 [Asterophora parasitica]|uniref:mRNA stability protein n=1 Tax=Asterophora parasitica TaxID=117018 RepID=A0A9P7KB94_9AGAR|nr:hypothetical protein DXG03_006021 [Asterophora parasitica]
MLILSIPLQKLSPQEQQLFAKYGKLPTHKNVLMKMQKVGGAVQRCLSSPNPVAQDRKYFDSGDYALSKAGVAPQNTVGTAIPNPENSTSPVNKESGLAHDRNSVVPVSADDAAALTSLTTTTAASEHTTD